MEEICKYRACIERTNGYILNLIKENLNEKYYGFLVSQTKIPPK